MEMVTNSHGTQVTIDGDNVENMNQLVRQVAYLNTREFPAPGRRRMELETKITCRDGTKVQVPYALSSILVLALKSTDFSFNSNITFCCISSPPRSSIGRRWYDHGARDFAVLVAHARHAHGPWLGV